MQEIEWWGYKHVNGTLQVKRYFGPEDISEAEASPMVLDTAGPWAVQNREEALKRAKQRWPEGIV